MNSLNGFVISHIRTFVPLAVAWFLGWLFTHGVQIDPSAGTALATGIGTILAGIYYGLVRLAEGRWPIVGVLLGVPAKPNYPPAPVKMKDASEYPDVEQAE